MEGQDVMTSFVYFLEPHLTLILDILLIFYIWNVSCLGRFTSEISTRARLMPQKGNRSRVPASVNSHFSIIVVIRHLQVQDCMSLVVLIQEYIKLAILENFTFIYILHLQFYSYCFHGEEQIISVKKVPPVGTEPVTHYYSGTSCITLSYLHA